MHCGAVVLLISALSAPASSQTAQSVPAAPKGPASSGKPWIYTNPKLGYRLAIPPGSRVLERKDDKAQISIRSRNGYMISVQAGNSRRQVPLEKLPGIIESRYFGQGKPWNHRLEDRMMTVAGFKAYEVNYEGPNNRSQVLFVRGKAYDYVFIFLSGAREYPLYIHEFDWVLKTFVPAKPASASAPAPAMTPSTSGTPSSPPTRATMFARPSLGYSMLYPSDWEQSEKPGMTMVFSGRAGSPAYTSIVSIQNIAPPGATGSVDAVKLAAEDVKANLVRTVPGVQFSTDQPWTYQHANISLVGRELLATYSHSGEQFRKLIIVIPRPGQKIAHVWSFTAPEADYRAFHPVARQMLQSWTLTGLNRG